MSLHKWDKATKDILECCELDPSNRLQYKGYLINLKAPNPYTGYKVLEEISIAKVKKKWAGYDFKWSCLEVKVAEEAIRINKKKDLEYDRLVLYNIDPIYRDMIINLFGIDGVEEFKKAYNLKWHGK